MRANPNAIVGIPAVAAASLFFLAGATVHAEDDRTNGATGSRHARVAAAIGTPNPTSETRPGTAGRPPATITPGPTSPMGERIRP